MCGIREYFIIGAIILCCGCAGGVSYREIYVYAPVEAQWIRDGQPLEFEGEKWFPADVVENLLDEEVAPVGNYQGVEIFIEKSDVRPYSRLYTKFGKHKYRLFEKNIEERFRR
ncbi:MAG: hypothetical protein ACOY3D_05825 [Candidatus Omnitrophota bacterium]